MSLACSKKAGATSKKGCRASISAKSPKWIPPCSRCSSPGCATPRRASRKSPLPTFPHRCRRSPVCTAWTACCSPPRIRSGYFGIRGNDAWIDEVMHHLDLTAKANANMRALSGGMKRRVLVAQALVHKPPVIVLDEPTAGVDVELRQGLWQFVRRLNREGHTIVLTTHYLEEAELHCNRIAMLKAGRVAALDSTRNLLGSFSGLELRLPLDAERLPEPFPAQVIARDGPLFTLRLASARELEAVLARLRESAIGIVELEVQPPDLEEVFLRLTGRRS